jgi:hypothetical protein
MNVNFTKEQMEAVAIVLNHIEGRFEIDPELLKTAVKDGSALWTEMLHASKRAERTYA